MPTKPILLVVLTLAIYLILAGIAAAQCQDEHQLVNYNSAGQLTCQCFIPGEQAGATFTIPTEHLPVEILRVGFGWGSWFGGAPNSVEESINIYEGALPNPGVPLFTLSGPVLTDGFINQFDLEAEPGEIIVNSKQVTATLTFRNPNAGDVFAPSVVHDGDGCVPFQNVVYAIPGGWSDACLLGVTGNWVVQLVYCAAGGISDVPGEEYTLTNTPAVVKLHSAYPNPFNPHTSIQFDLPNASHTRLTVHAVDGHLVATLVHGEMAQGTHTATWQGRDDRGRALPSGIYFMHLEAGGVTQTKRMVMLK